MDDAQIKELKPAVKRAAHQAYFNWGDLEADEVEQELWKFILERPSAQDYLINGNKAQRHKALTVQANHICSQERIDYERFSGNWRYSPREAKSLMLRVYGPSSEDHEVSVEEKLDLDVALERMAVFNEKYRKVLEDFFVNGTYDRKLEKDKRRLQRAIETLAQTMNTSRNVRFDQYEKENQNV